MRMRALALGFLAAVVATGCGADQISYVKANNNLLDGFPLPSGAQVLSQASSPYKESEWAWATVAGYGTTRAYRLPAGLSGSELITFYRRNRLGWRAVDPPGGLWISLRKGDAYAHVLVMRGERRYIVEMDHDCYKGDDWPHCFGP